MKKLLSNLLLVMALNPLRTLGEGPRPLDFFRRSPFLENEIQWNGDSGKLISFKTKNVPVLVVSGKLGGNSELRFENTVVSSPNGTFQFPIPLPKEPKLYTLSIKRGEEAITYHFYFAWRKTPPSLSLKIKDSSENIIEKSLEMDGTFPTEEWVDLFWVATPLSPHGVLASLVGLSFLSYSQTSFQTVETTAVSVGVNYQHSLGKNFTLNSEGQLFLIPLASNVSSTAPRLLRMEAGVESPRAKVSEPFSIAGELGFQYKTLITSESFGFKNLIGLKAKAKARYDFSLTRFLTACLDFGVFGSNSTLLSFSNHEIGAAISYGWRDVSRTFSAVQVGLEYGEISLRFSNGEAKGKIGSLFGVMEF